MPARKLISRCASTNGDGTGTFDATGDYSGASAINLKVTPPAGQVYDLHRVIVGIADTTMTAAKYGGIAAITNGVIVTVKNASGVIYTLTAFAIKSNGDWKRHCHDLLPEDYGAAANVISIRWTFAKTGAPITVSGDAGEYLNFALSDNFTGLTSHTFVVQGHITMAQH